MQAELNCIADSQCPFEYYCLEGVCEHLPMFPLRGWPIVVYVLLPFLVTICNIGGLSGGIYKVVVLMDMLNYRVGQATTLTYALITGGAFANFILLIPRRNPRNDTPLVDHGLVFILLPCILMGSTAGVIINKLLNDLIQDILVVLVCLYFAYKYFKKYNHRKRVERKLSADSRTSLLSGQDNSPTNLGPMTTEREAFNRHQRGYHVRQIVGSIFFFFALEIVTALCQGKIISFSMCSATYYVAFGGYMVFMVVIVLASYKFSEMRMKKYKRVGFEYINLEDPKIFGRIAFGGVAAGLLQGIIGMGSGHMISLILLGLQFAPEVTSATSGYIIFFVGSASLIEAFLLGECVWQQIVLIGGVTFFGSFVLTYLARLYLKKKSKLDTVIIFILATICVLSILGVAVNFILQMTTFGFSQLIEPKKFCA